MKLLHQPFALVLPVLIAITALTTGCQSPHRSESERTASIIITNRSSEQIKAATRAVFQHHQYEPARADDDELVFEKQGTFMNSVLSDDWFSGSVWERVKVYQHALDSERTQLNCDAYLVQAHEDPLFQKERKLGGHRSKYQALLQEIAENLNHQTTVHEKRNLAACYSFYPPYYPSLDFPTVRCPHTRLLNQILRIKNSKFLSSCPSRSS